MRTRGRKMKAPTQLIIFTFISCIAFSIADGTGNPEASTLLSIKAGLLDPLGALHDWNADSPHCNWTGVSCNSVGSVESLNLSRMNLSGLITDSIQQLPSLARINLCCNSFSSSLPRILPNLPMLREFDVRENAFEGPFPVGLGGCASLTSVNASGNNFSGPLPEDLANATALEVLDLRGSYFEGTIPVAYRSLKKLKFLGLSGNSLTGKIPPELGQMSSLEKIIIGYNGFEGSIPPELGNLTNLRWLDLAIGNLTGGIPAEFGKLHLLTTLFLYKNNLEGEIPKEIGNLSALSVLDISDNMISGKIPPELGQLSSLQLLNVMCNRLKGPVPASIGQLTQLEVLELWNNSLTGPLPADLGQRSPLQWLDVSSNSFSGKIPASLCNGGNLTKLIVFNNAFSGPIPALSACPSLVRVRMQNNRLTGTIPGGLGKLPKLQRLELASNDLSGEIPADIALSASLSFIDFSHNRFQLPLPSNILSMPTLQAFIASDNQLTGEIPDLFQDCPTLSVLDLSDNRLSGGIPASLASCERMVNLNLKNNQFTGDIPAAIARMPALAILDLSNNLLTGAIPNNFGSSPALEMLNMSYNNLSGEVPRTGLLRTINPDDLAGNAGLCGSVLPPCDRHSGLPSRQGSSRMKHIVTGWTIGVAVVLSVGVALFVAEQLYRRWHDRGCCEARFDEESSAWPWRLTAFQRLSFTSDELLACVKEANVIGMGATGVVYKAELQRTQTTAAVKKLWRPDNSAVAEGDFAREVSVLGRLRHRNIVRLLGYLRNETDTMIVYEFMPNGSLWEALHGPQSGRLLLDWVARYNVAAGVAQGLAYLHHDCRPPVIHRDIKTNNILLDANLEARIADFGLARMMVGKNETVTSVAGSYGYIAPEYGYTLKVDQKTDIYSFGVVLMELVTGKRPIEPEFGECHDIVGWVGEKLRSIEEVLDPSIAGQCKPVQEEMLLMLRIAVLCTAKLPKDRPSMRDVLTMLGEAKPRRKSSSNSLGVDVVTAKDKPVFSTSTDSGYL